MFGTTAHWNLPDHDFTHVACRATAPLPWPDLTIAAPDRTVAFLLAQSIMSRILVFGATGAIGGFLLAPLAASHRVIAASRAAHAQAAAGIEWIQVDLNGVPENWPQADTIVSLGPLDAFAGWLQGYPGSDLQRVLAISSMSALSKRDSADARERELAERLRASEASVLEVAATRGVACTIFRPTLIYGAGTDRSLAPASSIRVATVSGRGRAQSRSGCKRTGKDWPLVRQ